MLARVKHSFYQIGWGEKADALTQVLALLSGWRLL